MAMRRSPSLRSTRRRSTSSLQLTFSRSLTSFKRVRMASMDRGLKRNLAQRDASGSMMLGEAGNGRACGRKVGRGSN